MKTLMNAYRLMLVTVIFAALLISCNQDNGNANTKIIPPADTIHKKEAANPYVTTDQSPLDISYFPSDYPLLLMNGTAKGQPAARVIYSRPQKKGREIFGNSEKSLCLFGREWRLGANEATEIEFFEPVEINGNKINKGRYVIYCIPRPDKWTIVFNSNLNTWGLHMDTTKDVLKTDIPVSVQNPPVEYFTMIFTAASYGADLVMTWDDVKAVLPVELSK